MSRCSVWVSGIVSGQKCKGHKPLVRARGPISDRHPPCGVSGTARWVRLNASGRLPWRPGVDGSACAKPIQRPIPPGAHRSWLVPARISSDSSYRDRSLTGDCRDPGTGGSTRRGGASWARPRRPRVARRTIHSGFGWFSSAGSAVSARVEAMRSALAPLNCPR